MGITLFKGFITAGSLIVAIGAQNAYVLTQGLRGQYALTIAATCIVIDVCLIYAGIAGVGVVVAGEPVLLLGAALGGALFLTAYGARALYSAFNGQSMNTGGRVLHSRSNAIWVTAAISLLNPHVYLDTVLLIGSIGGQYPMPERIWFGAGAMLASTTWFLVLVIGARRLAPLFAKPETWRMLDVLVGMLMWSLAATLWWQAFGYYPAVSGGASLEFFNG
ncbi:amino acid transporter [Hahella sp. CCB-MM4]|uniref:LysE/ArgO family amino acid transporter n=1 Tax=Hahella sp. (strain CCB-MM4) TaxID=1926491 RepID=UPI000B9B8688|nr:LysE/ArgO family amino acid transporter [Hahella sp. CCB-MM4]OZG70728.1 amino acid transporter [Hahella sp. CCB-MM4]